MSMNDGGPAFPNVPSDPAYVKWDEGMSLLEYYAGQALPQCIDMVKVAVWSQTEVEQAASFAAGAAFDIAAAMVAEALKRRGGVA